MIRVKAEVLTRWVDSPFGYKEAEISADYPGIEYYDDLVMGMLTTPNLIVVEIVCSEAEYDAIDSDAKYTVLTSEVIEDE